MPHDIRIVHSCDFIRLDAEGHFDLEMTRKVFSDVIWACVLSRIGRVLVDIRDATAELSTAQLCTLANVCREVSPPHEEHRIAILTKPQAKFDRASFVAGLAHDQGWNIGVFCGFEEAFEWLAVS